MDANDISAGKKIPLDPETLWAVPVAREFAAQWLHTEEGSLLRPRVRATNGAVHWVVFEAPQEPIVVIFGKDNLPRRARPVWT